MLSLFNHRTGHYGALTLAAALLCLPYLGAPSLWDIDEGNNATCAAEMYQCGDFVLPTFNYQPREDKPALLYWLQMAAYRTLGINEFSARLPSALAAWLSLLAVYELGRCTFGSTIGLLAGVVLGSTLGLCAAGHFANPDALLHLCTLLTMLAFYRCYVEPAGSGIANFAWAGLWIGLGVLAKGPVALVLPVVAHGVFLWWEGKLSRLCDRRLVWVVVVFVAVAVPWYVAVALETKGQWLSGFLWKHNVGRALEPMENHHGPLWYYPAVLLVGFGLWSCFLAPVVWNTSRRLRDGTPADRSAVRFLLCWIAVYLAFFSIVRTKLPNYVLPAYPAGAILVACLLDDWRGGQARLPGWFVPGSLSALAGVGLLAALGLLLAGGALPAVPLPRRFPGLEKLAWLGVVPFAGAGLAAWHLRRGRRRDVVWTLSLTASAFTAGLAAWAPLAVDACKAPRGLVGCLPPGQLQREVRVACLDYAQPSLNFYCRREVLSCRDCDQALGFLESPLEAYLFLPADTWRELEPLAPDSTRLLGRRHDLYRNREVVVVGNR
jgi:4-amino-4-deoxy-L-arabinose transferase-like glycosyltransferase